MTTWNCSGENVSYFVCMVRESGRTSPLTGVCGGLCTDLHTPSYTLVVGDRCRICAVETWVDGWIAFEVDVESYASSQFITVLSTSNGVIRLQCLKSKIRYSLRRPLQV
jgi:hypothetical protein